ncbi:hybrid sensor histidine kinase/response regulator [Alistipes sp.]|uniref:hybrid sensor histidine kinase/response regulator transcription factor n=1 Tax=Alistipes sp. TaxID=1872444 RepID=UPI0025BA2C46|nr:hybrid sensor histidine kinase/response regulator [Alistipes sp.]
MKRFLTSILLTLACWIQVQASEHLLWKNISVGNMPMAVHAITRAENGLTWLGTDYGLFGYDGYKIYGYGPDNGFPKCQIYGVVSRKGTLYLGTNNGLRILETQSGAVRYPVTDHNPSEIRAMISVEDKLWIGALSGLYEYDFQTDELRKLTLDLPHEAVYALLYDRGHLYIGTYRGLCRYDLSNNRIEPIRLEYRGTDKSSIFVNALALDPGNWILHVGTEGSLLSYDLSAQRVVVENLKGNSVKSLQLCAKDILAGTDNGLYLLSEEQETTLYRHDSRIPGSIANNIIWSLKVDTEGNLLAGTDTGLSITNTTSALNIIQLSAMTGRGDGNQISSMLRDTDGALWLGGPNGIIRAADEETEWFLPGNANSGLSHNRVRDIFQDHNGTVWVATDGGLNRFDKRRHRFESFHIEDADGKYNANWCYSVVEDAAAHLWVGSYLGGIMAVDPATLGVCKVCRAQQAINTETGLPNNLVNRIALDSRGTLWAILFRDDSLIRIDDNSLQRISVKELTGNSPNTLYIDLDDEIWVGATDKLLRVSQEMEQTHVYRLPTSGSGSNNIIDLEKVGDNLWIVTSTGVWTLQSDSGEVNLLPVPDRSYSSIYLDPADGDVLLGSTDEIIQVNPAWIASGIRKKDVNIMRVIVDGKVASTPFLAETELSTITLKSASDELKIELSSLNCNPVMTYRYAYHIPGITDDYVVLPPGESTLSVPHLPSGSHELLIKHYDAGATPIKLQVRVLAPWYARWYAIGGYILVLGGATLSTIVLLRRRDRKRLEQRERDQTLASIRHKMEFLTNISHELKTPLSMILGPVSQLREEVTDKKMSHTLDVIHKNAVRINEMVHKTVEIDRVDLETEAPIIRSRVDVTEFCRSIFDSYAEAWPSVHFVFTADNEPLTAEWDIVKMESVFNNLISNACIYSKEYATIGCSIRRIGSSIEIRVSDDGVGIPAGEQQLIFQRLFRSSRTAELKNGTGIGLYLVKRYVEMHGGEIGVESCENMGTTFTVRLPYEAPKASATPTQETNPDLSRPRVLIVEDNRAVAEFIRDILSERYECQIASNGRAGLALLPTFRPELILTDEMMPVMPGLEMCRRIKAMPAFASISIIMVTAREDNETETQAARLGIDTFLSKPFEAPLLRALVEQRLQAKNAVRESLRIEQITTITPIVAESGSERQLDLVTRTIEEHIDDTELNVKTLCEKTGIGNKQLCRLIKKYAGVTPVEYIRQIRIKKAVVLLSQHKFTIAEIAYMVGFGTPSYFTKCFIAQYGCKPSQYSETSGQ